MTSDSRLTEFLVEWELRREGGTEPSPEELCPDDPQLREALRARIAEHRDFLTAIEPPTAGAEAPGAAPAIPGYEELEYLGSGGMGVVYRARHARLHRLVALKVVAGGRHEKPQRLARSRVEAEAIARLQHPNIVQIFEVGEHDGRSYLALEYLAGGSLAQAAGSPRPPAEAARLVATLARAVEAAHAQGIIHRDLKPANVLLAADGTPKVADFGLAKQLDADSGQTHSGDVMGTPSYMAPEQAEGHARDVGPAADIYALGAILYELLTGRAPFRGATVLETLEQVKHDEPVPPTRLLPRLPRDLETICLKCLEKLPQRRYASARELAEELDRFERGESILARPVGPLARTWRWCGRHRAVAGLLATLTVAILAGFAGVSTQWLRADRLRSVAEGQAEFLRQENSRTSVKLALSEYENANILAAQRHLEDCPPDRRFLEWNLVSRLQHRERRSFTDHDWYIRDVAFSPSGDRIASIAGGYFYSFQPGQSELLVRDAGTGEVRFERRGLRHGFKAAAFNPRLNGAELATGGALVFSEDEDERTATYIEGVLDTWDLNTGDRRTLDEIKGRCVTDVDYSPDGAVLAAAYGAFGDPTDHGYARLWDLATGKPLGEPFSSERGGYWALTFSPDGRWLALATIIRAISDETANRIEIWDWRQRKLLHAPFIVNSFINRLRFSPDGRYLASAEAEPHLIRIWDTTTGKEARTLKGHQGGVVGLAFRPDGKVLASCGEDHLVKLWDLTRGLEIETLRGHHDFVMSVDFDPEGRRLASGDITGCVKLWDPDRPQPLRLKTDGWVRRMALHPDGKRFVTSTSHGPAHTPQLWDLESGRLLRSFKGHDGWAESVSISPDGSLMASGSIDRTVRIWDLESGRQLAELDHRPWGLVHDVAFHPRDGTRLATGCSDGVLRLWTIDPTWRRPATPAVVAELDSAILDLAFRPPAGVELVTAAADRSVRLWNLETRAEAGPGLDLGEGFDVVFSRDGRFLAKSNGSRPFRPASVTVYDMDARVNRAHFALSNSVLGVDLNPDGTRLVSSCQDNTVRLWDLHTGNEVLNLRGEYVGGELRGGVAFSLDGTRLITQLHNQGILVWDARPVEQAQVGR